MKIRAVFEVEVDWTKEHLIPTTAAIGRILGQMVNKELQDPQYGLTLIVKDAKINPPKSIPIVNKDQEAARADLPKPVVPSAAESIRLREKSSRRLARLQAERRRNGW